MKYWNSNDSSKNFVTMRALKSDSSHSKMTTTYKLTRKEKILDSYKT